MVVGLDPGLTYDKLRIAAVALERGARFVATNLDASLPKEGGETWPGAGAIIAALPPRRAARPTWCWASRNRRCTTWRAPRLGTAPAATLAVGDRAETDILGGKRAGLPTALVLTGVTRAEQVPHLPPEMQPDYVFHNLEELTPGGASQASTAGCA